MNINIYKTTNLSVFLYEFETWALKLREEHKLMVSKNRVLKAYIIRVIKSRRMRWACDVARMEERRGA
jgi:hypothetical protein